MEDTSWTGVKLIYKCPNCGERGMQVFVIEGVRLDDAKAVPVAWKQRSSCKSCSKPLPDHLALDIVVTTGSLEQLRREGFSTPPVN